MKNEKLPIGYYLKKADNLLTENINKIQLEFGLTRTGWQLLNSIYQSNNSINRQLLSEIVKEFADINTINKEISHLKDKKLIVGQENLSLTDTGQELYSECLVKQTEFRKKVMKGISENEYVQTLNTLEKIINNLT